MNIATTHSTSATGTGLAPNFYEGPAEIAGDVHLHQRFFTYRVNAGLVAGKTFSVMFTIDRPAKDVWPHIKDLNPWQNAYGHYYSGVAGDLEGKSFNMSDKPNGEGVKLYDVMTFLYNVVRVIPEHVMVFMQSIPEAAAIAGVSPDCHVFSLHEHGGKTIVTVLMEHAALSKYDTEQEALRTWRDMAAESQRKWRDVFIPALRKLIHSTP
jgi:hypothetical protein